MSTLPITSTQFEDNPYDPVWFARDFLHSPDGVGEFPQHHCKQTFEVALPFAERFRTAVDVGCRDGEFTRYLQHHFAHTYAFDARARKRFRYNVDLRKVTHFTCALGERMEEIEMFGGTHDATRTHPRKVRSYPLDSFDLRCVDFIKIDVEGYERRVLTGAERTIDRDRPVIIIEQNDVTLPGEAPHAAKEWLEARGYRHVATCPRGWDHVMIPG